VFTRQLATLVKAGMPIMRSLEVLGAAGETIGFPHRDRGLRRHDPLGRKFSDGLAAHPKRSTGST
jgi:type II secretory pathway component PulF